PFMRYRAAAWLAGAIYSYAPYHLAHSGGHPDLVHLASIPLAVLLLYAAITRPSVLAALGAALMIGLAGFTSLYIMVFALLTVGPVLLFLLIDKHRWSQARIWRIVIIFGVTSVVLLTVRLVPIFRDGSALTSAIESKYTAILNQTDLLSYILPSHLNPLFAPYTSEIAAGFGFMSAKWPAYLGIVPLALTIIALAWKEQRKIVLLWLSIGLIFVVLSLGPALRLNGTLYEDIVLPARFLSWFPPIRAVGRPSFFVMGVLLPIAILSAFGFDRLLRALEGHRIVKLALMFALPGLLLIEYWSGDFPGYPSNVSPFYEQLAHEPGNYAIIQLPMGRGESKRYLFMQTYHQKPIVEGLSARTPIEAYQYIQSNPLLAGWFNDEQMDCSLRNNDRYISALDELIGDGFRYVVVHHTKSDILLRYADSFPQEPFYQDRDLTAFKLAELRDQPPCPSIFERVFTPPSPEVSTSINWDQKITLLGYDHPVIDSDSEVLSIPVYWQANSEMENSYLTYFHLVDPETGLINAQADVIPRGWSYPTYLWAKGEVVEDTVKISIENVLPGLYELRIGWFDEETGARLIPDADKLQLLPDGSTLLSSIEF
ncbi:MAG: hypothetical protein V3V74_01895, partial [Nitrosomonadaceae bacterium]